MVYDWHSAVSNIIPHFYSIAATAAASIIMFISIQKLEQPIWDTFVKYIIVMLRMNR